MDMTLVIEMLNKDRSKDERLDDNIVIRNAILAKVLEDDDVLKSSEMLNAVKGYLKDNDASILTQARLKAEEGAEKDVQQTRAAYMEILKNNGGGRGVSSMLLGDKPVAREPLPTLEVSAKDFTFVQGEDTIGDDIYPDGAPELPQVEVKEED